MALDLFRAGGVFMYPISAWQLIAATLIVLQIVRRDRSYLRMIWASLGMSSLCAVVAVIAGSMEAFAAIADAPPEMVDHLVYRSVSVALAPMLWALLGSFVLAHLLLPLSWWTQARRRVVSA